MWRARPSFVFCDLARAACASPRAFGRALMHGHGFARILFLSALSLFALLPSAPARAANDGCFLFICPPGVIPQAPRNKRPWWAPFEQPERAAPTTPSRPRTQRRREPPPPPEGKVYASAQEATDGKRNPPNQFVLVLGDYLASELAQGLADTYAADHDRIAIIAETSDRSGYLPTPLDWTTRFADAVAAATPTATVIALGSEDVVPIRDGAFTAAPLTDRWMELYARRVDDVLAALRARAGRVIVVGLAPVADETLSQDYRRLNELLRSRAARAGFAFVDVWDGFVDEEGKFLTFGPAVDGQRRRLRPADGLRFTRDGSRKLAFFVQKDLDRMLADPTKPSSGLAGAGPDRALTLAGAPENTGAQPTPVALTATSGKAAARALLEGLPPAPMRGRVDDFSWPPPDEAAQAAPAAPPLAPAPAPAPAQ